VPFVLGVAAIAAPGASCNGEFVKDRIAVTGVAVAPRSLYLHVDAADAPLIATIVPADATHTKVVWSSDDPSVATVSSDGKVSAVAVGTTTITVTTEDGGFTDTCLVTVSTASAGIALHPETLSLDVESSGTTLVAIVTPEGVTSDTLIWSSSDTSVATVNEEGEVSPVSEGTAHITVTTADGIFTATSTVTVHQTVAWVMGYFGPEQNLSSDSLHLAYSTDGLNWRALNGGAPVYQLSGMGKNQIRDPFILRRRDGTFVILATDWTRDDNTGYWSNPSPNIFVMDSIDLIDFTNPRLLQVTNRSGPNGTPMHAWSPEAVWDPERSKYAIIWSGNDTGGANRIYVTYTREFWQVQSATPRVFFDPVYSVIHATITPANNRNYLFFKDETYNSGSSLTGSGKDIQIARSYGPELTIGTFTRWDPNYITRGADQSTRQVTEGPLVIKIPGENRWFMFADYYRAGGVSGCWTTTDLDIDPGAWLRLSNDRFNLPPGVRQASAVRVTQPELDAVLDHYGSSSLIRSTASNCDGNPCYFAHSWFHGIISHLTDRSDGQSGNDFYWHIVPGLADPSDPRLVSFEPVSLPGYYAHIDSQDPTRYPYCASAGNRAESLCDVPAADRNHVVWVDRYEDSDTYRADATFRLVSALNGDLSRVSFQWYRDSTRYLRPTAFQMFVHAASTEQDRIDSSFSVE
jgi:hypothetical protein